MAEMNRLRRVIAFLNTKGWNYTYHEEDGCGSIDFDYRGVPYHIWEYKESGEYGVEMNLRHGGRQEDLTGDYETAMIEMMQSW